MIIDNEQFENVISYDVYNMLQEMSVEVLEESLKSQIRDSLSTRVNFLSTIEDITEFLTTMDTEDENKDNIINIIDELIETTVEEIGEVYDFYLNLEMIDSHIERIESTISLYKYLILRYKKNISNYIFNYIIKNRKALAEHFGQDIKKKVVTTISVKKKIKNKEGIIIISNLSSIIKYILSLNCDVNTFIEYSANSYYEAEHVKELYNKGLIHGSFINRYFEQMLDSYDNILDEIFEDVKYKLIEKLK